MKTSKPNFSPSSSASPVAAAPAAETAKGTGKVFKDENHTVIRETLPKGKEIPRHNHPATLLVTQTKGSSVFLFDGGKSQELRLGNVLKADDNEYFAIKITDDSEFVIVLVKGCRERSERKMTSVKAGVGCKNTNRLTTNKNKFCL